MSGCARRRGGFLPPRVIAAIAAALLLVPSTAFAQSERNATDKPSNTATARVDFSARAAGLDRIPDTDARVAKAERPARASERTPSNPPQTKRSFWKSPWPYVIVAAGVGIALAVKYAGDGGGY